VSELPSVNLTPSGILKVWVLPSLVGFGISVHKSHTMSGGRCRVVRVDPDEQAENGAAE
jgi:hypothetical protein